MMGLMTIKPAQGPIRTSPVANARLFRKYLGNMVRETKYKQLQPRPNVRPKVKYIIVKLGA